jgi:hypothetical protein
MNELLAKVIDAHGGMERWKEYERVDTTIVSGGGFFPLKGVPQDSNPRRMTVWLHEERSSVLPYGAPDQRTMFTSDRIAIEKLDGTLRGGALGVGIVVSTNLAGDPRNPPAQCRPPAWRIGIGHRSVIDAAIDVDEG